MSFNSETYFEIKKSSDKHHAKLAVVTKYVGVKEIEEAFEVGARVFAENKSKDALNKKTELNQAILDQTEWHFIGHLQSNKVKDVVGNFKLIHSIDSIKLANSVNSAAQQKNLIQDVLIQINISEEEAKSGFSKEQIREVFSELIKLTSINIQGFMAVALNTTDETKLRKQFQELREIKESIESEFKTKLPELSMGMSNDYQIALEEGATIIRIGHILFNK